MSSAAPRVDPRFPGLTPEVVQGYLDAPSSMVAEVLDGALSLLPRPRRQHARAAGKLALLRHVEFGASGACCACGSKL